jgi:flagellar biosynthesis protein
LKKKPKTAVALRYDPLKDRAPRVAAKGMGSVAEKIIELAKQNDIPVKDDPDLVEILAKLDIEQEIPADVYLVVAELLAFVYSVNNK